MNKTDTQISFKQLIEDAIVGKIVNALLDEQFRVEISDQDGGGLYIYATDGDGKPSGGFKYWIRLTLGNGRDILTDYTTNLEKILKPVHDFINLIED